MILRPIKPRRLNLGKHEHFYVTVPIDIRSQIHLKTRRFERIKDAEAFAAELTAERAALHKLNAVSEKLKELGKDPFIRSLIRNGNGYTPRQTKSDAATVSDTIPKFLESKKTGRLVRENYSAALKCSMASFESACGNRKLSDVKISDIEEWLASHAEWKPRTKLGRLIDIRNFFNWCLTRQLVERNPALGVERPRIDYVVPKILKVEEIEKLLRTAERIDPAIVGYLALLIFGGLRPKEAQRTLPENIQNGRVVLQGSQTKTNIPRAFDASPTLLAWLASPGSIIGGINIRSRMDKVRKLSGVVIPHDALRHSTASYYFELYGATLAAKMLGNSEAILKRHYTALVTKEDAQKFIALRPVA